MEENRIKYSENRIKYNENTIIMLVLLIVGSVIMLLPFLWMLLSAFKTYQETLAIPIQWLPRELFLEDGRFTLSNSFVNFSEVLGRLDFGLYYRNTIFVTVTITVVQMLVCSLGAYAFARIEFPGRNIIFFGLLSMLMIPQQMTLIPSFVLLTNLGWINTFRALTIPMFFSAYGTFFLRQFFLTLPKELEESAFIDGASHFRVYWQICLPLCKSAIAALSIFVVLWSWNDLLWPLIMTSSSSVRVLSVGISTLIGQYHTRNDWFMAASILATAPMIIVFIIGQKRIVSGIAITGIKS